MMVKKYLIRAGAVIGTALFIYGYGQMQYRAGRADAETAQYVADLERFKQEVERLHSVSAHILQSSERLNIVTNDIIKEYTNEVNQNPLPTDCIMSDGRLRLINDIIRESTATRQSGSTMPRSQAVK